MSIAKIDSYLKRITDPGKRANLIEVKNYVIRLDVYIARLSKDGVREISKEYKVTEPEDVNFYKKSGIDLKKNILTQIVDFKERIAIETVNDEIEPDFVGLVCSYFGCDVRKIEELYEDLINKLEVGEVKLIEKIDALQKTLGKLPYLHLRPKLDVSDFRRRVYLLLERLGKHKIVGIGRPFLVRLGFMKKSGNKEPVSLEDMEFIANRIEKDVKQWEIVLNEHAINCDERKIINEVMKAKAKVPKTIEPGKVSFGIK